MLRYRLATVFTTALLVSVIVAGPVSARPSPAPIRAQDDSAPQLVFTALQLADHVRYTVTLLRPLSATVTNVRVDVELPAGSEVFGTLETQGRSVFLGSEGNTLSWAAPGYEPGDPVDPFTFRLTRPLGSAAQVRASWQVDGQSGRQEIQAAPAIEIASAAAGEVTLRSGIETGPIGETGVRVELDPESGLDGVQLRLTKPGPEANPPAGVGTPWWCAALAVAGLPEGASVFVVVPLRQPLPPGTRVDLFAERGGTWERLADQGHATVDGQFVAFRHPGGTVAAGVLTTLQPTASLATVTLAQRTPKLQLRLSLERFSQVTSLISVSESRVRVSEVGGAPAEQIRVRVVVASGGLLRAIFGEEAGVVCQPLLLASSGDCQIPSLAAGSTRSIRIQLQAPPWVSCPPPGVQFGAQVNVTAANNIIPNRPDNPTTTAADSGFIRFCA